MHGNILRLLNDPVAIYELNLSAGVVIRRSCCQPYLWGRGIMHRFNSIMLKDDNGEPAPVYSVASGLDYPSSGPEHAFLYDIGRVKYDGDYR